MNWIEMLLPNFLIWHEIKAYIKGTLKCLKLVYDFINLMKNEFPRVEKFLRTGMHKPSLQLTTEE